MTGCQKNTIYGSGLQVEDVRTINGIYNSVSVHDGLMLVIDTTLEENMVAIRCDEEILSNVTLKLRMNELNVGYKNNFTFQTPLITEIRIPDSPMITEFKLHRSTMIANSRIERDSVILSAEHSSVKIAGQIDYLDLKAEKGSSVTLQGFARNSTFLLSKSVVNDEGFYTDYCRATLVDSFLKLGCNTSLTATLSERSRLEYYGAAQTQIKKSDDSETTFYTDSEL